MRSKIAILTIGLAGAIAMVPVGSEAQSGFYHEFCMAQATQECTDGGNLGYPDFASCGAARYDQCMGENGQPTGDGRVIFGPAFYPRCNVAGRIDAGTITDPSTQCST